MGKPAARIGDMHICPEVLPNGVPHGGGPIIGPGSTTVYIEGKPAATAGDGCLCNGGLDKIVAGSTGVFIEGREAARQGDRCAHGGVVAGGSSTVFIGERIDGSLLKLPGFGKVDEKFVEPSEEEKRVIINQAIKDCISLLNRKLELLRNEDPNTLAEFKKWFGRDDEEARQTILTRIERALKVSKELTEANFNEIIDEKEKRETCAQVYSDDTSHRIELGVDFWNIDNTGKDSRSGVLIHELSHFYDVGGTKDEMYGEYCIDLAKDYPNSALKNADSFEYFIVS